MRGYIKPPAVKRNSTIGLITPSDGIEKRHFKNVEVSIKELRAMGFRVKLAEHLFSIVDDFAAGSVSERIDDIKKMIFDPKVQVIWATEGGYAANEVLAVFTEEVVAHLKKYPKWFIGYSDMSVLLNALTSFGIVNIHGPNVASFASWDDESKLWIKNILTGKNAKSLGSDCHWKPLIPGVVEGRLLVSNLDSLIAVLGTRFDPLMQGSESVILAIEDYGVEKSTMRRQLDTILNHKKSGRIKGMIVGRFVAMGEEYYSVWSKKVTAETVIEERLRLRGGIPLVLLSDFGHAEELNFIQERLPFLRRAQTFFAMPNGIRCRLTVEGSTASLEMLETVAQDI